MKKLFFFLSFISIFSLQAQVDTVPDFIKNELETYIIKGMDDWEIPGLAVAIIKDGKVAWMKGYGKTSISSGAPVDENTLFMIGSNTKAFTGTALAMLAAEGKLSLDDKVQKWLPNFKLKDPLASKEANIKDVLSHRIGFETFQGDFTYWTSNLTRAEVIEKMGTIEALYSFRARWGYCNAGYVTAGEIIPKASGDQWETYIQKNILNPLNMDRTIMLSADLKKAENVAQPHTLVEQKMSVIPIPVIDNLAAAGSISSSVADMVKWLQAQIDNGRVGEEQIIPLGAIQAVRQPQTILGMDPRNGEATHFYLYGLGWMINDRTGKLIFSHTGGVNGFLSAVQIIPEEKLGIVVLTNTDQNNFFQDLANEIRDAYLGLPFRDYSGKSLKNFKANQQENQARIGFAPGSR